MLLKPERVEAAVMACCCLHITRMRRPSEAITAADVEDPLTHEVTPGAWTSEDSMRALDQNNNERGPMAARNLRDYLKEYYNSPLGAVAWQDKYA